MTIKSLERTRREMGSPSSELAQEAFWKGKAEGVSGIVRRIGRAAANWLLRGGDRRCLFGSRLEEHPPCILCSFAHNRRPFQELLVEVLGLLKRQ